MKILMYKFTHPEDGRVWRYLSKPTPCRDHRKRDYRCAWCCLGSQDSVQVQDHKV